MSVYEKQVKVPKINTPNLIEHFKKELNLDQSLVRFVVTSSEKNHYNCEVGICDIKNHPLSSSVFEFSKRPYENTSKFNTVLVIPTGIGAEFGGHAGDGGPVAQLMGQVSDQLIVHPNAVNGAEINEMPANSIYIEGSTLSRLMMGVVGLRPVRSNRILTIMDNNSQKDVLNLHINAAGAARATAGINCDETIVLDPGILATVLMSNTGRANGKITNLDSVIDQLKKRAKGFDAIAVVSILNLQSEIFEEYFSSFGDDVNPWGGVEAMMTHSLTEILGIPTAHAPMHNFSWDEYDPGIIDPRKCAEIISFSNTTCVYKGLHKSPKIVTDPQMINSESVISAKDVSCLVIPDNCLGLPTLAALYQGIPVIAVKNKNVMKNNLAELPWARGQFFQVNSYFEAVGVVSAMRAGIDMQSLQRPIHPSAVEYVQLQNKEVQEQVVAATVQ